MTLPGRVTKPGPGKGEAQEQSDFPVPAWQGSLTGNGHCQAPVT